MFFMGAAFEIEECRVALIFELLVDADRGGVVPVDGGFFNGNKKSLFEPSEAFFVLADLLQQCHLLIRGTFRSAILSRAVKTSRPKSLRALVRVRDDIVYEFVNASCLGARGMFVRGNNDLGKRVDGLNLLGVEELWRMGSDSPGRAAASALWRRWAAL